MANHLSNNLAALRARTGHDPILGPRGARPQIDVNEPADAARARVRDVVRERPAPAFFVIGCGDGAILDAIAAHAPAAEVLAFEPDPAAASLLLEQRDWTERILAGRLAVFVGPDYQGASGFWRPASVTVGGLPVLVDPVLAGSRPDAARQAEKFVDRIIEEGRANAEARRAHAGRYLFHTLANAAAIAREGDAASLIDAFRGTPALIVGAGPSLDGRLPEIAAIADRAVVIACAAAARPLLAAQIAPRFIVSVDPTEANAMHLLGLPARPSWLVAEGSLHPTALHAFDRRTFTFNLSDHHPWPWLRTLGVTRGRVATWGSSATSALDLALRMGCSPIMFAGLDFAFTGGRPYCRGTTFESTWAVRMGAGETFEELCRAIVNRWPVTLEPDLDGRMERTAPHLVSFRNWMRQQIEADSHVRFMNVTPGGILHHRFVEHCSPEEAIGAAPALDAKAIDARLRDLHRRTAPQTDALFEAIERLLADPSGASSPIADWSAFTGGTLRLEAFAAALRSHEYQAWIRGRRQTPAPTPAPFLTR